MLRIFAAYIDIAFFRRGPESLPPSVVLLVLTLIVDALINLLAYKALALDLVFHVASYVIGLAMVVSITLLLLNALRLQNRFLPTITALAGTDCVLSVFLLAIGLLGPDWAAVENVDDAPLALLAIQLIVVWGYAILGFVLKRAGGLNLLGTIGVVLSIYILADGAISLIPVEGR